MITYIVCGKSLQPPLSRLATGERRCCRARLVPEPAVGATSHSITSLVRWRSEIRESGWPPAGEAK